MKFSELGIIEPILKSITFDEPTEIQEKAIPVILEGKDVIAGSATGSGKTLAFAAGIIQNVEKGKGIHALVLVPTRELAQQVSQDIINFSKFKQLQVAAVFGGVSINPQMNALKYADVVVGTPGRVLDHLERRTIDLSKVDIIVLDEADRMLDMGFIDDVRNIMSQCKKERQTLLFSATVSRELSELAKHYMNNPVKVSVDSYVDPKLLKQIYYDVDDGVKFSLLVHLLKREISGLAMVFCNTKRSTDNITKNLNKQGIEALAIHGGLSQAKRTMTMNQFHRKKFSVLVCTDVASRGLDIGEVTHIYNYDLPMDSKSYIHRIGRTARAGNKGKAISLLSSRDHDNFSAILRDNDVDIQREPMPEVERLALVRDERRRPGFRRRSSFRRR